MVSMYKLLEAQNISLVHPTVVSEEANIYYHCQHFLYARLQNKYTGPDEFTDNFHNLGAFLLRRRGRQQCSWLFVI